MVLGNGMIAKRFEEYCDDEKFLIFASGVSNSNTKDENEYLRELNLLTENLKDHPGKTLVYFSTCSIYDNALQDSLYNQHKLHLENLIRTKHNSYVIFRISNPIGKTTNAFTVVNFFIDHIVNKKPFAVWENATRNLLDIDDMYNACNHILKDKNNFNSVINIANPRNYPVLDIVKMIEKHFKTSGIYNLEKKGSSPVIDISKIAKVYEKMNISFGDDYFLNILHKYFPQ